MTESECKEEYKKAISEYVDENDNFRTLTNQIPNLNQSVQKTVILQIISIIESINPDDPNDYFVAIKVKDANNQVKDVDFKVLQLHYKPLI